MGRQIRKLAWLGLVNLFGINEFCYTKDSKKKKRYLGLALIWCLLVALGIFYVAAQSCFLLKFGLGELVPEMLFAMSGLLMLFFTFFKAGSVIFGLKSYEMLISLPVSETAIVVSRFLVMYVTNFLFGFLVVVPGSVLYGLFLKPSYSFYFYSFLGLLFLPLLPLSAATAVGAGIMAVTSRMRHKSIVSAFLTIAFAVVLITLSMGAPEEPDMAMLQNLAAVAGEKIGRIYPPARWYQNAAVHGSLSSFLLLAAVSITVFAILVTALKNCFLPVCSALNATSARNDFKLRSLSAGSVTAALVKKEARRYFASGVYISNTLIGYIMMVMIAIALLVTGPQKLEEMLQMPEIIAKIMPLLLGGIVSVTPVTACSVSMEGKSWWRLQTLPVSRRDIFNGKLLFAFVLASPFYALAEALALIALKPSLEDAFWLLLLPALYIVFISTVGLAVNFAMPVFDWENETQPVKQSASMLVTMLTGFAGFLLPFFAVIVLKGERRSLIYLLTAAVLAAVSCGVYFRSSVEKAVKRGSDSPHSE